MATVPGTLTFSAGSILTAAQLNTYLTNAITYFLQPPHAVLRQTINQTLTSGAWTALTMDVEDVDTDNSHSTTTNTSRYTANTAGWYDCIGRASFNSAASTANQRGGRLHVNGAVVNGSGTYGQSSAGDVTGLMCGRHVFLNVADYVEVCAFQNSGNNGVTTAATNGDIAPSMSIKWTST